MRIMPPRVAIEQLHLQPIEKGGASAPPAYRLVIDGKPQVQPLYWSLSAAEEAAAETERRLSSN